MAPEDHLWLPFEGRPLPPPIMSDEPAILPCVSVGWVEQDVHQSAMQHRLGAPLRRGAAMRRGRAEDEEGGGKGAAPGQLLKQARASGVLNLSSRQLTALPAEVLGLHEALGQDEKFWEVVDLTRLDVSHNSLSSLPAELGPQLGRSLRVLQARHNQLTGLPTTLEAQHFPALTNLDLSSNALVSPLPDGLCSLSPTLRDLNLSGNRLAELPADFGALLASLETLHLSVNQLERLPDSLGRGGGWPLQTLTLSDNRLTRLPRLCLPNLRVLEVARNQLTDEEEQQGRGGALDLSGLPGLAHLDLRENRLTAVPRLPPQPNRLAQVYLGLNRLGRGGGGLEGAEGLVGPCLSDLDLQGNGLRCLPDQLGLLVGLKVLDVSNNDLPDLPPALGHLPCLTRMAVDGNPIRAIRRTLLAGPCSELKKFLTTRGPPHPQLAQQQAQPHKASSGRRREEQDDHHQQQQQEGPEASGLEGWLEEEARARARAGLANGLLDLSRLMMTTAQQQPPRRRQQQGGGSSQDDAALVQALLSWVLSSCWPSSSRPCRRLDLSGNGLQALPPLPPHQQLLPALTDLSLADNDINAPVSPSCWASLCSLPSLQKLDLSKNTRLPLLPPVAGAGLCMSLQHLDLRHCRLTALPPLLTSSPPLSSLHTLLLSYNGLTSLHRLTLAAPSLLPRLAVLDVSNNRVSSLGPEDDDDSRGGQAYGQLTSLNLENNDLQVVPSWLAGLPQLTTLLVSGNPQRSIRPDTIAKGSAAVLAHLRRLLPPPAPAAALVPPSSSSRTAQHQDEEVAAPVVPQCPPRSQREVEEEVWQLCRAIEALETRLDEAGGLSVRQAAEGRRELARLRAQRARLQQPTTTTQLSSSRR